MSPGSKRHQKEKDATVPGIKRRKAIPRKTPEKDSIQEVQEKGSPNLLKSKEKASGSGAHKANGQRVSAEEAEGN